MQQQPRRSTGGAKAIALDPRVTLARYRLYQLVALLLTAGVSFGLHLLLGR